MQKQINSKIYPLVTVILLLLSLATMSQNISDSLLYSFSNKTMVSHFENELLNRKPRKEVIPVITSLDASKLIQSCGKIKFEFFQKQEDINFKKHVNSRTREKTLYNLSYKIVSNDTIDIDFTKSLIVLNKDKKIDINVYCGGTKGYIPSGRFIYNNEMQEWLFFSHNEIMSAKALEEDSKLKKIFEQNKINDNTNDIEN